MRQFYSSFFYIFTTSPSVDLRIFTSWDSVIPLKQFPLNMCRNFRRLQLLGCLVSFSLDAKNGHFFFYFSEPISSWIISYLIASNFRWTFFAQVMIVLKFCFFFLVGLLGMMNHVFPHNCLRSPETQNYIAKSFLENVSFRSS